MKKEIKRLWVDALRSGQYKQAKGHVYGGGFEPDCGCAVGVLGLLYAKHNKTTPPFMTEFFYAGSPFLAWAGVEPLACSFYDNTELGQVSSFNDNTVASFADVADFIEEHVSDEDTPSGPAPTSMAALERVMERARYARNFPDFQTLQQERLLVYGSSPVAIEFLEADARMTATETEIVARRPLGARIRELVLSSFV